jgi:hypothetical protein
MNIKPQKHCLSSLQRWMANKKNHLAMVICENEQIVF